jgi:hypothetical protein
LAQPAVRGVEGGRDGPFTDRDGGGDRPVVEIGVVPQEQNEPLPFGQLLDGRPDELTARIVDRRAKVRRLVELTTICQTQPSRSPRPSKR